MARYRRRTQRAVEPGVAHHLDDGRHATTFFAQQPAERVVELDLGGGVGAIAELVLEPLDVEAVRLPSGASAARESTTTSRRLRQREEGVAHRRRAEPFVADQAVLAARAAIASGAAIVCWRARRSRPALGHRHADRGRRTSR